MPSLLDPVSSLPQSKSVDAIHPIEARLQLAAIVDSSDDAIISKDLEGIITSWNASAARLFGYQPAEIIGRSVLTLIPPELHSEEPEILRRVTSGQRIEHFETRRRRKDGEIINISLTISPIRDTTGRIIGISKIARDITERKLTEAALFESERMAAIGRMAATIAHEVNNPLEAILNLGYLLSRHPSLDPEAINYAELLVTEVLRVSDITRRTLSFYRDTSNPAHVDMTSILESVLNLHRPLLEQRSITVVTKFHPDALVWSRAGELRQVFTNLIVNAIDAMPTGGQLRISVTTSPLRDQVCVTVADNGPGIPAAIRTRIFEPFFSTKLAKGTGLGLWISQGIIRKYGGSIRMRSTTAPAARAGTAFRVCLPTHQSPAVR
jgi:PAS domain S-box-containing protein